MRKKKRFFAHICKRRGGPHLDVLMLAEAVDVVLKTQTEPTT